MQETEGKEAEIFDAVQNVYHIWDASLFDPWGHLSIHSQIMGQLTYTNTCKGKIRILKFKAEEAKW